MREILSQECPCLTFLSLALKRRCSKSVKISGDCRVLCSWGSPLSMTKPCNQRLFNLNPLLCFHNHFCLYLLPECQCDVKGTLSGVGDCEQVRFSLFCSPSPLLVIFICVASSDSPDSQWSFHCLGQPWLHVFNYYYYYHV